MHIHNSHSLVPAKDISSQKLDKKCNNNQLRLKISVKYAWQFIISSLLLNVTLEVPLLHPYKVSDRSTKELGQHMNSKTSFSAVCFIKSKHPKAILAVKCY